MKPTTIDGFRARLVERRQNGSKLNFRVDLTFPDGSRRRLSLGTSVPAEAEREFREWQAQVFPALRQAWRAERAGSVEDVQGDPRIEEVLTHYVASYLPAKNSAKKSLLKAEQVVREFSDYCRRRHVGRMSQLAPAIVDGWAIELRDRGNAAKTIHNMLALLRAALNAAVDRGLIDESPVKKWLMPRVPDPEIWPFSPEQARRILSIIHEQRPDIEAAVRWIAYTGNRPSDAVALEWHQVDIRRAIVIRPQVKTKRLAEYEISPEAVALLEAEQARGVQSERVFTAEDGTAFTVDGLYHAFSRALVAGGGIGRRATLKDFRHTFGSLMANEMGCPLPVLQRLMGHADIHTTMRYVHPSSGAEYVRHYTETLAPALAHRRHTAKNARKIA